jgi:hypothetical protein
VSAEPIRDLYRCARAARWLPRVLAGSVLAAAMLASFRIDPRVDAMGWGPVRTFVVLGGAVVALLILRKGAEVRTVVELDGEAVTFRQGGREASLPHRDLDSLEYAPPLSASRHWLPAAVLVDRWGKAWRLSAVLERGDRLIERLAAVTGRSDLESWIEALRLRRRMGRAGRLCLIGYLAAAAILAGGLVFYLTAPGS